MSFVIIIIDINYNIIIIIIGSDSFCYQYMSTGYNFVFFHSIQYVIFSRYASNLNF